MIKTRSGVPGNAVECRLRSAVLPVVAITPLAHRLLVYFERRKAMGIRVSNPTTLSNSSIEKYLSSWGTKFHAFAVKHEMEFPHMGLIREHFAQDLGLPDQEVELHADGKLTSHGKTIFTL